MNFKYNSSHLKYLQEHGQTADLYSQLSAFEHEQVKGFIPIQPKVIMDLGCGLGRASVYLNWILHPQDANNDIHYILADTCPEIIQTEQVTQPMQFSQEEYAHWLGGQQYYESLDLTASFCTLNGLLNFGLFDTRKSDWNSLSNIDYIMSRNFYGISIPIESIMDKLLKITTQDVTMIFGTRNRELYTLNSFTDIFKEVYIIKESKQEPFPLQDWLILKEKK